MGEATARTEESLTAIRTSIEQIATQVCSLDARIGLLDTSYSQVASNLDNNARAVGDHSRIMDAIERRQELMNQQMAKLAETLTRLDKAKAPLTVDLGTPEPGAQRGLGDGLLLSPTAGAQGPLSPTPILTKRRQWWLGQHPQHSQN